MGHPATSAEDTVPAPGGSRKLPSIQVLRGAAASLVVFHHYAGAVHQYSARRSWIVSSGLGILGASGVDLFFVISGFIMVYTTTRKSGADDALSFLSKRALRIYPLYWLWTTVLLIVVALWHAGGQGTHHFSASFIVKSYLLIPAFDGRNFHPFLSQGWTLSFEMLFYLVFAGGILIDFRRWRLALLVAAFAAISLGSLALPAGSGMRYLLSEPMILEFLFGVLGAEVLLRMPSAAAPRAGKSDAASATGWSRWLPVASISAGALALVATLGFAPSANLRFLAWGAPALGIVFGAARLGPRPCPRFFVYLGDASYSIYLTHGFFSLGYATALRRIPAIGRISPDATILVMGTLTILASSLFFPLVERPLMAAIAPRKTRRTSFPAEQGARTLDAAKLESVS